MLPKANKRLGGLINPSNLNVLVQFMELTYTYPDGEPIPAYAPLFAMRAEKEEDRGKEEYYVTTEINTSIVHFRVNHLSEFRSTTLNFNTMKLMEIIGTPTATGGNDSFGNPLYAEATTTHNMYQITDFQEIGHRAGWRISCRLVE